MSAADNAVNWLATAWSALAWVGLVFAGVEAWRRRLRDSQPHAVWLLRAFALIGFVTTWTFMLLMTMEDVRKYPSFFQWLVGSNLFFDAYQAVSGSPAAWWLSSQLMTWATAGVIFFQSEGSRRSVPSWCYLWIAMCVAVSVALPLFLLQLLNKPVDRKPSLSPLLLVCVVFSSMAVTLTPLVEGVWFKWVMLALHAPVLVGAVLSMRHPTEHSQKRVDISLVAAAVFSALMYWWATWDFLSSGGMTSLTQSLSGNHALSSISLDVLLTIVICSWWVGFERGARGALLFLGACLLAGVGTAFPLYVLSRNRRASA